MTGIIFGLLAFMSVGFAAEEVQHEGKTLPIFNVVKFKNDACTGTNKARNGTCYTTEECTSKGGSNTGSCAEGFGVCCTIVVNKCGMSSSENNTYLDKPADFTSGTCRTTICPLSSNICRIRFDFSKFVLANQGSGYATDSAVSIAQMKTYSSTGKCINDAFVISGEPGAPVICGTNTGGHMIVDASTNCHEVTFHVDSSSGTTRDWDIHIRQYTCQDSLAGDGMGGPPGCLQYYTATTGWLANYASVHLTDPTKAVTHADKAVVTQPHLVSQAYLMCIRRAKGYCQICYSTEVYKGYGLSVTSKASSTAKKGESTSGSACMTDFLIIPGAVTVAKASTIATFANAHTAADAICGRKFDNKSTQADATVTVCTRAVPFVVAFNSDDEEPNYQGTTLGTLITLANLKAKGTQESDMQEIPGGIEGFGLHYVQHNTATCT